MLDRARRGFTIHDPTTIATYAGYIYTYGAYMYDMVVDSTIDDAGYMYTYGAYMYNMGTETTRASARASRLISRPRTVERGR